MKKILPVAFIVFVVLISFNIFSLKDKVYMLYNAFLDKIYSLKEAKQNTSNICKLNFYSLSLNALLYENRELKELLRYKTDNSFLAKIIDKRIEKSFFVLNSKASPRKKYIAISPQGYALGFAEDNFLFLFSSAGRTIDGYIIKDDEKLNLKAEAIMPGSFKAEINKEFKIKLGDKVYFDLWPVGIIYNIEAIKNSPYNNVYIALPFNLSDLSNILLVEYE